MTIHHVTIHHTLWISFFQESWLAGAPYTAGELKTALHLSGKNELSRVEVSQLGDSPGPCKVLMQVAPGHVLGLGLVYKILEEDPAFAKTLSDEQLAKITQLSAKDDANWVVCRKVIAELKPAAGLRHAISLVCMSRELGDLDLVREMYLASDRFTRT